MMRLALLAIFASLVCSALAVTVPYKSCGSGHLTIATIDAQNWPPLKGSNDALNVTGKLDEDVTQGKYKISIKVDGIPLPSETGSIDTFKPLPWSQGEFSFVYTPAIPSIAPSGSYSIQLEAHDQSGSQILCIGLQFKLAADEVVESPSPVQKLMNRGKYAQSKIAPVVEEARIEDAATAQIIKRHIRTKYSRAQPVKVQN